MFFAVRTLGAVRPPPRRFELLGFDPCCGNKDQILVDI